MSKISQNKLNVLRARGVTVKSKKVAKKEPVKEQPVMKDIPQVSTDDIRDLRSGLSKEIAEQNALVLDQIKEILQKEEKPRKPWKFTVNRNKHGGLTDVVATPID